MFIKNTSMKVIYGVCSVSIAVAIYISNINLILAGLSVGYCAGIINTFYNTNREDAL